MGLYSHSKLSSYEQCKLKYKLRYIDKIKPDVEKSIEAHLGTIVHDSLEWLYGEVLRGRIRTIEELIKYYSVKWEADYAPGTVIVKEGMTDKDYFNKGVGFLVDYYLKHTPFNDGTIELEKRIFIDLGEHKLQGYIDRLTKNPVTGEYAVHDYKTANSLPDKYNVEKDRQLGIYSLAIKEAFGFDKDVLLIWHYLAFNQKITSNRTNSQLEELKKEILQLIGRIEAEDNFTANKSVLCGWCEYKTMCPCFGGRLPETQQKLGGYPVAEGCLK